MDQSPDKLPSLCCDLGAELKRQVLQEVRKEIADEMKKQVSGQMKQLSKQMKQLEGEIEALKTDVEQQHADLEDLAEYNQDTEEMIDDRIYDKFQTFEHDLKEQKQRTRENTNTIAKLDRDRTEMRMHVTELFARADAIEHGTYRMTPVPGLTQKEPRSTTYESSIYQAGGLATQPNLSSYPSTAEKHVPNTTTSQQGLKHADQSSSNSLTPKYGNSSRRKRSRPLYDDSSHEYIDGQPTRKKTSQEVESYPQLDGSSDAPAYNSKGSDSVTLCSRGNHSDGAYDGSDSDAICNSTARHDSVASTVMTRNTKAPAYTVNSLDDAMVGEGHLPKGSPYPGLEARQATPSSPVYPTVASYELQTYVDAERTARSPAFGSAITATESGSGATAKPVLLVPTSIFPTAEESEENDTFDHGYRGRLRKPSELLKTKKALENDSVVARAAYK